MAGEQVPGVGRTSVGRLTQEESVLMLLGGIVVASCLLSYWAAGSLAQGRFHAARLDVPNERSLHHVLTPRTGLWRSWRS